MTTTMGNVIGMKWGFVKPNGSGQRVINTYGPDICLVVLHSIEKDMNSRGLSIFDDIDDQNHIIKRCFRYMDEGDHAMARYILIDKLHPHGYSSSRDTNDWYSDLNDTLNNLFKLLIGVVFLVRKRCHTCNLVESRKRSSTIIPMVPFYQNSHDPTRMFAQFQDDLEYHSVGQYPYNRCIAHTENCKGPSTNISKRIVKILGNIMVFVVSSMSNIHLKDIPVMPMFDGKRFVLRAAIGRSTTHFVGYIQDGEVGFIMMDWQQ